MPCAKDILEIIKCLLETEKEEKIIKIHGIESGIKMKPGYETISVVIPSDQNFKLRFYDGFALMLLKHIKDIANELKISPKHACNIYLCRTHSFWTQEKEDELINMSSLDDIKIKIWLEEETKKCDLKTLTEKEKGQLRRKIYRMIALLLIVISLCLMLIFQNGIGLVVLYLSIIIMLFVEFIFDLV